MGLGCAVECGGVAGSVGASAAAMWGGRSVGARALLLLRFALALARWVSKVATRRSRRSQRRARVLGGGGEGRGEKVREWCWR